MNLKSELHSQCNGILNSRLELIKNTIADIQKSLETETKSTAGDKHETGRAMLQIEREKAGQQLAELQKQFEILNKINPEHNQNSVALGSVVLTSKSNYFLGLSLGELSFDGKTFYAISMATPMAKLLLSKAKGDSVVFRGETITITKVL